MSKPLSIPPYLTDAQLSAVKKVKRSQTCFYYNETYALATKEILDKLHSQKHVVRVEKGSLAINTLRLQYYQGAKYLLDFLDKDKVYSSLYAHTRCISFENYLEFHIRQDRQGIIASKIVIPWREDFEVFIETAAPNEKFFRDNLVLAEDDIIWINAQLAPLVKKDEHGAESPLFFGEIKEDHILLIRDEN